MDLKKPTIDHVVEAFQAFSEDPIAQAASATASMLQEPPRKKCKREYNCGRCGQPKRGHVCSADSGLVKDVAVKDGEDKMVAVKNGEDKDVAINDSEGKDSEDKHIAVKGSSFR